MPGRTRRRGAEGNRTPRGRGTPELVVAGRAFVRGRLQPVEIGLDGEGRILRVARSVPGGRRADFGDSVLLPSAVDLHVHLRDPGPPGAPEEFATGSVQAALGGVGLVADMPNTTPPTTSVDRLESKASRARGRLAVDALLFALAVNPRQIRATARSAGAFKLYLAPTTEVTPPSAWGDVDEILQAVSQTGLSLTVHAEDAARFHDAGSCHDPTQWNACRPPEAELAAVEHLLNAPPTLRLHLAHVSTPAAAQKLRAAGHSFEATPHHLLLNETAGRDGRFKVNPPLRDEVSRRALWGMFVAGEVPSLASDHAPHALEAKERSFELAPAGMPGVETMLPLLLERVREGELGLSTLIRASGEHPSLWLGLAQGRLAPGFRGNLVVVDFRRRSALRALDLHAPCGWTPFEGRPAILPTDHFLDGQRIVEDGEYVGTPRGTILRPEYAPGGRSPSPPAHSF